MLQDAHAADQRLQMCSADALAWVREESESMLVRLRAMGQNKVVRIICVDVRSSRRDAASLVGTHVSDYDHVASFGWPLSADLEENVTRCVRQVMNEMWFFPEAFAATDAVPKAAMMTQRKGMFALVTYGDSPIPSWFPLNSMVILRGLITRSDLNEKIGRVIDEKKGDGRVGVQILGTWLGTGMGEEVRVRMANLDLANARYAAVCVALGNLG